MSGGRVQTTVEVTSPQGLHMRPLTAMSQVAAKYAADIKIAKDDNWVDAKSVWEMMLLLSPQGTIVTLQAIGPDATEAVDAIRAEMQRWAEIDAADNAAVQG